MNRDSGDNDDDGIKIPPRVAPNDNNDDTRLSGTDLHQQNQNQDQEKKTRTTPTRTTPLFDVMQMEFTLPNQHESVRTYTVRK
jgi:hypothetical protein